MIVPVSSARRRKRKRCLFCAAHPIEVLTRAQTTKTWTSVVA